MAKLLEVNNLTYLAGGRKIIDDLCLSINTGEVHALIGTNGTGKSTLACLIMGCGSCRATEGEILFAGHRINDLEIHERATQGITMAWQEPARFEGLSVREYLSLKPSEVTADTCLTMVGLEPRTYLDRQVDKALSGGERKRIELASILAISPQLALLDEPDSGIDMLSTSEIIKVIESLRASGAAVLLITHRDEIARIADRASLLCGGRIICTGPPETVADRYRERRCAVCNSWECDYAGD
ncbi:putative ABC transporter ATP-binding protein [Geobacter sp. OR-1]|uniref:ATP-binding cassette domain-containing protein n=1 Tax=Geobacter sp. OR-1 TaxID=1266765 RepID=UPI000542784C|nr:ABC transporter ATP-binding protein [Geobacter sp. OR-1]GAM08313.1 putative ABC transporter ATP-binding protein [Geobacter sp. OR-1]